MKELEHQEQCALIRWAKAQSAAMPELKLLFSIPNGGARHIRVATKLKAEGQRAGVPDLFLPAARGDYHGLFIEMKKQKGGTVSENQKQWHSDLIAQNYRVAVCHGWDMARETILEYLK
jgi:hypothetical protein